MTQKLTFFCRNTTQIVTHTGFFFQNYLQILCKTNVISDNYNVVEPKSSVEYIFSLNHSKILKRRSLKKETNTGNKELSLFIRINNDLISFEIISLIMICHSILNNSWGNKYCNSKKNNNLMFIIIFTLILNLNVFLIFNKPMNWMIVLFFLMYF